MADRPQSWDELERRLNEVPAGEAENYERQLVRFRPVVLREDVTDEELAYYYAAIRHSTVTQMMEMLTRGPPERRRARSPRASATPSWASTEQT